MNDPVVRVASQKKEGSWVLKLHFNSLVVHGRRVSIADFMVAFAISFEGWLFFIFVIKLLSGKRKGRLNRV